MVECKIIVIVDYVEDIYQSMLSAESDEMEKAYKELVDMTPDPMNSMVKKQPKGEAIKKMLDRKEMVVTNVPPTAGKTVMKSETVIQNTVCKV